MGKKNREKRVKKPIPQHTLEDRKMHRDQIVGKLETLGLFPGQHQPIAEIHEILDKFVETGESASGKIQFPAANRRIEYLLSNRKTVVPTVNLMYCGVRSTNNAK